MKRSDAKQGTMPVKSIFDGWTKQIIGKGTDGKGGYCARGWAYAFARDKIHEIDKRLGAWIMQNLDPPFSSRHPTGCLQYPTECYADAVIWANSEGKLDIEGFKMVDLLTQGYVPDFRETLPSVEEADAAWDSSIDISV